MIFLGEKSQWIEHIYRTKNCPICPINIWDIMVNIWDIMGNMGQELSWLMWDIMGILVGDHWRKRMATLVLEIKQFAMKNKVYIYIYLTILYYTETWFQTCFFFPPSLGGGKSTESSSDIFSKYHFKYPPKFLGDPWRPSTSEKLSVTSHFSRPRHPGLWDDLRPATFLRWGRWSGSVGPWVRGCVPKMAPLVDLPWIYHGYTIEFHIDSFGLWDFEIFWRCLNSGK